MKICKRLDPNDPNMGLAEKTLHLTRYQYVASTIKKFHRPQAKILDAACGLAHGTNILCRQTNLKTIGIDIDMRLISNLTIKFIDHKKMQFIDASIESLPFTDNFFDYIVCFETIEHLKLLQAQKAIKEFGRTIKPGGYLFISSPNPFFTKIMKKIIPQYHNPYHLYEFYPHELKSLLNKTGFKVVESRGQYPFFPLLYLLIDKLPFLKFFFEPKPFFLPQVSRYFIYMGKKV